MCDKHMSLKYDDLVLHYKAVIDHFVKNSDKFAMITTTKKPYSESPPICEHDNVLLPFAPYMLEQKVSIKEWPGAMTKDIHKVMKIYRSCKSTRLLLLNLPNIFTPIENHLPEDIGFYRSDDSYLATISHEKIAFVLNPSQADIAFFKEKSIWVHIYE